MRENFKIDLYDIFTSKGKEVNETLAFTPEHVTVGGNTYEVRECSGIDLRLRNTAQGKAYLSGEFTAVLIMPCDRCLADTEQKIALSFERELIDEELRREDRDAGESGFLDGNLLDVYALIGEELLLNLPAKVLCREDCRGLCPVCGKDRNNGDCGCDTFVPDPRLAGLSDILKGMNKEV